MYFIESLGAEFEISSPESNDSGIHSEDRLNRLDSNPGTATTTTQSNSLKTSAENSLYSSVISSKKSSDKLSRETSAYSRLDEFGEMLPSIEPLLDPIESQQDLPQQQEQQQSADEYDEEANVNRYSSFKHLEQHELPLGWVRCCGRCYAY